MRSKKSLALFGMALSAGMIGAGGASAQNGFGRQRGGGGSTPFRITFQQQWTMTLPDPVKLIEIGQVTAAKKNNLIFVIDTDTKQFKRRLEVAHWDGLRFSADTTNDFLGTSVDVLLAAHFKGDPAPNAVPIAPQPTLGSSKQRAPKPVLPPPDQVVTTEGVYTWTGKSMSRMYTAPPNARMALMLGEPKDVLVTGSGDQADVFELSATDARRAVSGPPKDADGYARLGVGMQDFTGSATANIMPNVRFVQSVFTSHDKFMIGVVVGKPIVQPDGTSKPSGDRLVVYAPRPGVHTESFWGMATTDFDETWRSDVMAGRILDVRYGDPKNDGKDGLLVLTSENDDKDRHLYFFTQSTAGFGR